MNFRKLMFCLFILAALLFEASLGYAIAEGDEFPSSIKIMGYKKGLISQKSLKGKVTVINFWATWCESCKVEIKEMQSKFKPLFKDKNFRAAFVSLDKDPDKASAWMNGNLERNSRILKSLFQDPKFSAAEELEIDSFPMTLVVGKDAVVRYIQRGYKEGENSTDKIVEITRNLLSKV